jgi:transcriptional regulator with XRE-family HTH domain
MKSRNREFHRERLKELRKAVEISQRDLAIILGVSEALPGLWESGNSKGPCGDNEEKLANLFGVQPDFFRSDEYSGIPLSIFEKKAEIDRLLAESPKPIEKAELKIELSKAEPVDEKLEPLSRILGVSVEKIERIEKHFTGIEKVAEYSKLVKAQIENHRQFQNTIDSFIGKVNERFLELEDLRKRAIKLAEEVGKDSEDIEFQFLNVKASG